MECSALFAEYRTRLIEFGTLVWDIGGVSLHHIRICTQCHATHCSTHCNTLQRTATHCNTLQRTATHCNTHRNTLQHTATYCDALQHTATHCNALQHTATHCNTLQHTATHCNTQAAYVRGRAEHEAAAASCIRAQVCNMLQCVLQCVAVWCGACCSVLQYGAECVAVCAALCCSQSTRP